MRVLVLGASGFAGRAFRPVAEAAGFEVVGSARHPDVSDLVCDLLDPPSIEAAILRSRPEVVVNLAGAASVTQSLQQPGATFEVNALGALNLLQAVTVHAPEAHVLCVSSGDVYGDVPPAELPVGEQRQLAPETPYAASKAAMEVVCGQFERARGLRVTIARSFNHTGPGQSDDFAASSFARQIAEAERDGEPEAMLEVGNLDPLRDFGDVRDVARAYVAILKGGLTGTFNVSSGRPIRIRRVVELLAEASTIPVRFEAVPERARPGEPEALYGSSELLERETGWRPEIPLAKTMTDLLDWWRHQVELRR